jgi:hypothetical protein
MGRNKTTWRRSNASSPWSVEPLDGSVTRISFASRLWVLLSSDWHWDSVKCDRDKLAADLAMARELNAAVLCIGDLFDAMGGKYDPRSNGKWDVRPEFQKGNYFDDIVNQCADWLEPYREQMALITPGNHECVDGDTEVLCESGWKRIADVTVNDRVGMIHPETKEFMWAFPLRTHAYDYEGKMRHVKTRSCDMLVTPNHRICYLSQKARKVSYIAAGELLSTKGQTLSVPSSGFTVADDDAHSDDELRLAGWMMTDGSFSKGTWTIYQSKAQMVEQIRDLLTRLGVEHKERVVNRNITHVAGVKLKNPCLPQHSFVMSAATSRALEQRLGLYSKQAFPEWVSRISSRQFAVLLDSLVDGDGSRKKEHPNSLMLYGERVFLDAVQWMCVQHGYRAMLSLRKRRTGQPDYWCLNITKNEGVSFSGRDATDVDFSGKVYCLTTPSGNFFMRRNGKVCVTGNSAVRKRQETCLTTRLTERLRTRGSKVRSAGYAGWVMFRAKNGTTNTALYRLFYHHGYGGGGFVTRGIIDYSRYLVDVDADCVHAGHVHQRTLIEASRQRLSPQGIARIAPIHLVRSAAYKQESLSDGWAVEKGMSARPLGGWWMLLRWNTDKTGLRASFHDAPRDGNDDA